MKKVLVPFLAAVFLLISAAEMPAGISKGEREAAEEWMKTLGDLKESDIALPITKNDLAVVFNLRDVPALLELTARKNDYAFNLFMNVDRRGMVISSGISCYVEDFVTFETARTIHIFVKMRATEIPTPVWTALENLEYAVWGGSAF